MTYFAVRDIGRSLSADIASTASHRNVRDVRNAPQEGHSATLALQQLLSFFWKVLAFWGSQGLRSVFVGFKAKRDCAHYRQQKSFGPPGTSR